MPNYGDDQILGVGLQTVPEVAVTPGTVLGVVFGGILSETQEVDTTYGTESRIALVSEYTKTSASGSCNLLFQDPAILEMAFQRDNYGKLKSYTLDGGVNINGLILPRRFVGSKVGRAALVGDLDEPILTEMEWNSLYVEDGDAPSYFPDNETIWLTDHALISYGGNPLTGVQRFRIEVENNLESQYLASRDSLDPRGPSSLIEGNQVLTARLTTWDRIPPPLRNLRPLHDPSGFTVQFALTEYVSNTEGILSLTGCFQPLTKEPFSPQNSVDYEIGLSVQALSWMTIS